MVKLKGLILIAGLLVFGNFKAMCQDEEPETETKDVSSYNALLMFPAAPDPAETKTLIRTYLPENDPFSSIRILSADSTLVKEIPLATETGISSTPLAVGDFANGNYIYQLFYKGETRITRTFTVKH